MDGLKASGQKESPAAGSMDNADEGENGLPIISAANRAFVIVEALSRVKSSRLETLAAKTGLAKPTVYRFLNTLRELGYVWRDEGERWYLGLKLFSVGARALDHLELPEVAKPVAQELSESLGEAVHVGVLDEEDALYILKIESRYTIRMYSRVGKRIPLYCTAIGKILLADMDSEGRDAWFANRRLVPFTPHTLHTSAELEAELQEIRKQGWARDREEHEEGVTCIAVPIRDHCGKAVAAISMSWPLFRFETEREEEYRQALLAAAGRIEAVLGARA